MVPPCQIFPGNGPLLPVDAVVRPGLQVDDLPHVVELAVALVHIFAAQGGAVGVEAVADDGADVLLDGAEALDAHGAEDPEALALEILEHWAGLLPIVAVRTAAMAASQKIILFILILLFYYSYKCSTKLFKYASRLVYGGSTVFSLASA